MNVFSAAAIGCYCIATYCVVTQMLRPALGIARVKPQILGFGGLAVVLHGWVLYQGLLSSAGVDLSVANAASLVAWLVVLLLLSATLTKPLENMAVVLLPLAAVAIAAQYFVPGTRIMSVDTPLGIQTHVTLSILAYSVLTIAAVQAAMIAIADRQLRLKRPGFALRMLPPLQTMEDLLFQLVWLGFILLSIGLAIGFVFVENLMGQHLAHKTVLSSLAWLVFAVLLWGRYFFGWRGSAAVRYTIGGFVALLIAFFGSKIVLELILQRV